MKKITLLILLAIAVISAKALPTLTDPLIISNFEGTVSSGTNYNPTYYYGDKGCVITTMVDPDNALNSIMKFTRSATASTWHGPQWGNATTGPAVATAGIPCGTNSATQYRYLVAKLKKSTTYSCQVSLQATSLTNLTFTASNSIVVGSWVYYIFDVSAANNTYKMVYFMPESGGTASEAITYFDDIYFTNSLTSLGLTDASISTFTTVGVSYNNRTSTSVDLAWSPVPTATSYKVLDGTTVLASGIVGISSTISGLTQGSTYSLKVVGVNSTAESTPSTAISYITRKGGANYEVIDDFDGVNQPWAAMSGGVTTLGFANPAVSGSNTSAKCAKVAFAANAANYSGMQTTIEKILAGTSANYRYLHVKIQRTATALGGIKMKLTKGGVASTTEQELLVLNTTDIKNDGTWQDYVFDLKYALDGTTPISEQYYRGFFFMPNFTVAAMTQASTIYIDDVYLSNSAAPLTTNINPAIVTLVSNNLTMGTVSGTGAYIKGVSTTVIATPLLGYKFTKWNDGTSDVSTLSTYSFVPTADVTLTATFEVDNTTNINNTTENAKLMQNGRSLQIQNFEGSVRVYNTVGKLVAIKANNASIQLNNAGIYLVKLQSAGGNEVFKIIVK
jgi:hypothetical protein